MGSSDLDQRASAAEGAADGKGHTNRLIDSTSPYLLQHAHNPVDWEPWGAAALERAQRENKPIFLSIGYSACHWCHVMEREVFENQEIANIMNRHFVNIKVDREERPDIDELYMMATQVTTGSGGWPMSVWLTPELEPFYAGTYFPPVDGYGRPGFPRLCLALAEAWAKKEGEVKEQAGRIVETVRGHVNETMGREVGDARTELAQWAQLAVEQWADRFDDEYGGVGGAPKFPPSQAILLWLELLRPQHDFVSMETRTLLRTMLTTTLDHMMRGGIYDQVGGGFARYSTDQYWLVPHFEKMLYDNGQLAQGYAAAGIQMGRHDYSRAARQSLDFWLREMTSGEGAFYSALDADSEGVEGKFYVWTLGEIKEALPNGDDAALIIKHFGVTEEGNWHEGGAGERGGANVLFVARPVEGLAKEYGTTPENLQKRVDGICLTLRKKRAGKVGPRLDDKILTGWNGLMISALASSGRLLREPRYLEAAHRAIGFMLMEHMQAGRMLMRTSRKGSEAHTPAFLEDHAYLLNGLMDLVESTSPTSLPGTMSRKRALELADAMVKAFEDKENGGFYFTTDVHDKLFARMKNATDGAVPSANGVAIRALLRLARSSGKEEYRTTAMRAVEAFAGQIEKQPMMFATVLLGLAEDARLAVDAPALNMPVVMMGEGRRSSGRVSVGGFVEKIGGNLPEGIEGAGNVGGVLTVKVGEAVSVKEGEVFELPLEVRIAEGYHIQTHTPKDREAFATVVRVRGELPLAGQEWHYPEGKAIELSSFFAEGYEGAIVITGRCAVAATARAGKYTLRATVLAQPCSATSCLAPERATVEVVVEVV